MSPSIFYAKVLFKGIIYNHINMIKIYIYNSLGAVPYLAPPSTPTKSPEYNQSSRKEASVSAPPDSPALIRAVEAKLLHPLGQRMQR